MLNVNSETIHPALHDWAPPFNAYSSSPPEKRVLSLPKQLLPFLTTPENPQRIQ